MLLMTSVGTHLEPGCCPELPSPLLCSRSLHTHKLMSSGFRFPLQSVTSNYLYIYFFNVHLLVVDTKGGMVCLLSTSFLCCCIMLSMLLFSAFSL